LPLLYIFVNQQVHQANELLHEHYKIATNIAIRKTTSTNANNMVVVIFNNAYIYDSTISCCCAGYE